MNKTVAKMVVALGLLAALFVSTLLIYALTFEPNDYKPHIIRLVQEKKQRTLTLEGDIKLLFFPKLGVDLGRSWISERQGERQFASLQHARFYFSWLPLLKRKVVIDHVSLEGVGAILVRHPDGSTNFDDLLEKESQTWLKFKLKTIKVKNGLWLLEDKLNERNMVWTMPDFQYRPGERLTLSSKMVIDRPKINTDLKFSSQFKFDLARQYFSMNAVRLDIAGIAGTLSDLDLTLTGDMEGHWKKKEYAAKEVQLNGQGRLGKKELNINVGMASLSKEGADSIVNNLKVAAKLKNSQDSMVLELSVPALQGKGGTVSAPMTLQWRGNQGRFGVQGVATSSLTIKGQQSEIDLTRFIASAEVKNENLFRTAVPFKLAGDGKLNWQRATGGVNLAGTLGDSRLQAALKLGEPPVRYGFDIAIDRIDLDRYLTGKSSRQPGGEWDLTELRHMAAAGTLRLGYLKYGEVSAANLTFTIQ